MAGIQILRKLLVQAIDDIDAGNSNMSEAEISEATKMLAKFSRKDEKLSKYQAYTYLGISRATFDNLVREGRLPKGIKQPGFKELCWYKKDLIKHLKKDNI